MEKMDDVRGKGCLAGVELMQSRNTKEPVGARQIQAVVDFCREDGLIGAAWGRTVSGVWFAVAYGY
jgi:4-aminobutyrate aminotransferase-like enzyme